MYHPGAHALNRPDQPAVIIAGTDQQISHKELNERSNRIAQFLHGQGFRPGDHIAILMENNLRYFEVFWAALRSGLIFTPINRYFTPDEAAYVVNDSGAKALFTSAHMGETARALVNSIPDCPFRLIVDGSCPGYDELDAALATFPKTPLTNEPRGQMMLYSSGTTGRPTRTSTLAGALQSIKGVSFEKVMVASDLGLRDKEAPVGSDQRASLRRRVGRSPPFMSP